MRELITIEVRWESGSQAYVDIRTETQHLSSGKVMRHKIGGFVHDAIDAAFNIKPDHVIDFRIITA